MRSGWFTPVYQYLDALFAGTGYTYDTQPRLLLLKSKIGAW